MRGLVFLKSERNIIEDLVKLSKDDRLSRIFSQNDKICLLNLWILETKNSKNNSIDLLYGLIIPSTMHSNSDDRKKWFSPNPPPKLKRLVKNDDSVKFRVVKLSFFDEGKNILKIIKGLCEGLTLKDSCKDLNILKQLEGPFDGLKLSDSPNKINEYYIIRPVVFLETYQCIERFVEPMKQLKSPLCDSPAFIGSIFQLNKFSIFSKNGETLPYSFELMKKSLELLKNDLGLNFKGSDSPRLGNIEFLCFSAADDHEISNIIFNTVVEQDENIKLEKQANKIKLKILDDNLIGKYILARCRLRNSNEIILDQCKELIICNNPEIVYFKAEEEISEILITVWKRKDKNEQWEIFYENSNQVLREIFTNFGITGLSGKLKSNLLDNIKTRDPEIKSRIIQAENIQQTYFNLSKLSSYKFDPWVPASNEIRGFARSLFPQPSGGHFFPRDWGQTNEGILSFIEWIDSLTSDNENAKIIIFDPYFAGLGVYLISKSKSTNIKFRVYTTNDAQLKDKSLNTQQIIEKCTELSYLLSTKNLRIYEFKGKNRFFHDRYILLYDDKDNLKNGYHLSNSIQRATVNHPLLVTPIPTDLLDKVDEYVSSLILGADSSESVELIQIFPFNKPITDNKISIIRIPYVFTFFRELLQNNGIMMLNEVQLSKFLRKWGLMKEENKFVLDQSILYNSENFIQSLVRSSDSDFAKLWMALGEWLYLTNNSREFLETIINSKYKSGLIDRLKSFFLNVHKFEFFLESYDNQSIQTLFFANLMSGKDFFKILYEVKHDVEMGPRFSWPNINNVKYGAMILMFDDHNILIDVISKIMKSLEIWKSNTREYYDKMLINIITMRLISIFLRFLRKYANYGRPTLIKTN
jgi:hypothetical protein